ncbi:MAG TPA: tetratricopeptide repeat protein [Candidatus Wujingus californicus]|uniref:tetratricopeptide repeat protein n=1 Tax=Candidatus Wujingus californicus TaxID=3367618 RepID=UPI004028FA98
MTTKQTYLKYILPLIISISAILYINTLHHTFVYDDSHIITENYLIKTLKNLPKLFTKDYLPLSAELSYRPIVTLTYFIDYAIWRLNPIGYHLTNVILHTINVFLFYVFTKSILRKLTPALIATLLFLSHPLLTETVNAVCYREDILASVFFLLSFIYFAKIRAQKQTNARFIIYYTISCIAYCFALFSKEMAITLPLLLMLFEVFCASHNTIKSSSEISVSAKARRWILPYVGYAFIAGFYLLIRFIIFKNTFKIIEIYPGNAFAMTKIVASYLKLLFIPLNLNADYYISETRVFSIPFILSVLLIALTIFIIVRFCKKNRQIIFFSLWFFIALLPVLDIIPIGNIMAERYLYLPIIGLCGAIGSLFSTYTFRKRELVIAGVILFSMQIGVVYRNGVWRDDTSLWLHTFKREPNSARAYGNLGNVFFRNKQYEEAIQMYKKSLTLKYSYPFIYYNLGVAYEKLGMTDKAIEAYSASISRLHENTLAFNNLGTIYHKQGLYNQAIESYKQALLTNPYYPLTHHNLGNTYEKIGDVEKALAEYAEALKIDNTYADVHNNIGAIYLKRGNTDEAIEAFRKAIQSKPDHKDAHYNLGITYAGKGLYEESLKEFNLAIKYSPEDFAALRDLGILYFKYKKDITKSLYYLNESLKLANDPVEINKLKEFINAINAEQGF